MTEQEQEKKIVKARAADTVLIYGSGQCDQFGIALDQEQQTIFQKPRVIDSKLLNSIQINKIACGGMHTLLLTKKGVLLSWGCNDDFALGRQQDTKNLIKQVVFQQPISDISAGDSHSVAYSAVSQKLYIWGQYRNIISGNIGSKTAKPAVVQQHFMKNLMIKGIASGSHHTLIHAGNKIYSWGDPESGAIGRKIKTRGKNSSCLRIQAIKARNPVKVWAGSLCSFYKDEAGRIFAFGSNNYGQLGIGNLQDKYTPTLIPDFSKNIIQICGGEHHTVALSYQGQVYVWGRNDDHQLGLNIDQGCIKSPTKINSIEGIAQIQCGNHFSFALSGNGELYSWGAGDQFVLGNESEQTEKEPFLIPTNFFPKDFNIKCVASGAQHVVVVGSSDQESIMNFKSMKDKILEIQEGIRGARGKTTSERLKKQLQNADQNEEKTNRPLKQKLSFFVSMSQKLEANRQGGYSGVKGKTNEQLDEMYQKEEEQRKLNAKPQYPKSLNKQSKQQVKSCGFFVNKEQKQKANSKGTYLGVKGYSKTQLYEIYQKEQKQRAAKQKKQNSKTVFPQSSATATSSSQFTFKNPFKSTSSSSNPFKSAPLPSKDHNNTNPFSAFKASPNSNINPFTKFTFKKQQDE